MEIKLASYFERFVSSHEIILAISRHASFRPPRFCGRKLAQTILRLLQPHISKIVYQRCVLSQVSCVNPRIDLPRPHLQAIWISPSYLFAVSTKPIDLKSDPGLPSPSGKVLLVRFPSFVFFFLTLISQQVAEEADVLCLAHTRLITMPM